MRAYVSIRGSRSPRSVHRDASPQPAYTKRGTIPPAPYASLSIGHPDGTVTTYEIAYLPVRNGEGAIIGAKVAVTADVPSLGLKALYEETVTI